MVLQVVPQHQDLTITWEPLPEDFILPDDPVENIQQPFLASALTDALAANDRVQPNLLLASNMAVVATINHRTIVKAPDWFYVPRVLPVPENVIRRSYTPTLEGDPISIAMEFLSDTELGEYSVRPAYPYGKLYFYEQVLKISTYVIFDPYDVSLEVHRLIDGRYILQTVTAEGRFWIPELELFLGIWHGQHVGLTINWLRWWDQAGNLLLWSAERTEQESQRAEQEHQRAEKLAAYLRSLGVDPDQIP